jgi:hypothetical protein
MRRQTKRPCPCGAFCRALFRKRTGDPSYHGSILSGQLWRRGVCVALILARRLARGPGSQRHADPHSLPNGSMIGPSRRPCSLPTGEATDEVGQPGERQPNLGAGRACHKHGHAAPARGFNTSIPDARLTDPRLALEQESARAVLVEKRLDCSQLRLASGQRPRMHSSPTGVCLVPDAVKMRASCAARALARAASTGLRSRPCVLEASPAERRRPSACCKRPEIRGIAATAPGF